MEDLEKLLCFPPRLSVWILCRTYVVHPNFGKIPLFLLWTWIDTELFTLDFPPRLWEDTILWLGAMFPPGLWGSCHAFHLEFKNIQCFPPKIWEGPLLSTLNFGIVLCISIQSFGRKRPNSSFHILRPKWGRIGAPCLGPFWWFTLLPVHFPPF